MPRLAIVGLLLLAAAGLVRTVAPAGAASATLSVSPASQTVDPGASFSIAVVQNADVVTTGAQTDISFDPSLLQVVSVDKGAAYSTASLVIGIAPQTTAQAIAEANTNGTLQNVSAFYLPGAGSVPAGATDFVVVQMQAKPQFGGVSPITLAEVEMLDNASGAVPVTLNAGEVTVNGATPSPSPTPDPNATPTPTPVATPTPMATPAPTPFATDPPPVCNVPTSTPEAILVVSPASLAVPPGSKFNVDILQRVGALTTGAGADFNFDPKLLQVVSVEKGTAYAKATLLYGEIVSNTGENRTGAIAIADANASGLLNDVSTLFLPGQGTVKAGENIVVRITLQAKSAEGFSPLRLSGACVLNEAGFEMTVGVQHGEIRVDVNAPPPPAPVPLGAVRAPRALPAGGGAQDNAPELEWLSNVLLALGSISVAGSLVAWRVRRSR